MDLPLSRDVILTRALPEERLQADDVGVVIVRHEVAERETGDRIEFFDMVGNTWMVIMVPAYELRAPTAADRPAGVAFVE